MQNRLASFMGRRSPLLEGEGEGEEFTLTTWIPRVDIAEDDKQQVVKAELPLREKRGGKSLRRKRYSPVSERPRRRKRIRNITASNRAYGTFMRSFTLPEGTSSAKINAEFRTGS